MELDEREDMKENGENDALQLPLARWSKRRDRFNKSGVAHAHEISMSLSGILKTDMAIGDQEREATAADNRRTISSVS